MRSNVKLSDSCQAVLDQCIGCNQCVSECQFLQKINEDPVSIARRGPTVEEAYSCFLCGLCKSVCPASVDMKKMFEYARENAVEDHYVDIDSYRYMFPDRTHTVMSVYREVYGIDYHDLEPDKKGKVAFFPGCSLLTYSPELTRELFRRLGTLYPELTFVADCCGLPLFQLGMKERGETFILNLRTKLSAMGVTSIIFACPNCYYQMNNCLQDSDVRLLTVYEALDEIKDWQQNSADGRIVTIHDSCPDRLHGIYSGQSRNALSLKGYQVKEMNHNRELTICCGSGGQVSHSQPELAYKNMEIRMKEAESTEAEILAAYCLGCVLNLARVSEKLEVQHILNLLFDYHSDYSNVKAQAKKIFEGIEGLEYWEKIMAE